MYIVFVCMQHSHMYVDYVRTQVDPGYGHVLHSIFIKLINQFALYITYTYSNIHV